VGAVNNHVKSALLVVEKLKQWNKLLILLAGAELCSNINYQGHRNPLISKKASNHSVEENMN